MPSYSSDNRCHWSIISICLVSACYVVIIVTIPSLTCRLLHSGIAWGDVRWRDRMVLSSQDVYSRLLRATPNAESLSFDILAQTAKFPDGTLDQEKLKHLIRLFRPDRDGTFKFSPSPVLPLFYLTCISSPQGNWTSYSLLKALIKCTRKPNFYELR